ncbi:MAG: ABC transporter ATP-binding protein [Dehalococcoidia bacterium]|nr:ABC transporter ATP-binding protein [Dehalococcoidia bacterium]MEE2927168.1 ATP-binding cassette domain-containing protein [Chloroflexota bacterium]
MVTQDSKSLMIHATGLTHYYGPYAAIEDVNFGVERGEVLGFLGPNGAGKTTTMRILTGYMPPTRGKVTLDDFDIVEQSLEVRRKVGYLPETVPLYTDMPVNGYLKYMGTLRQMPPKDIKRRISEVIDVCRLGDYRSTLIGKLSKGFRQRVGIAQAILHEPEVLVLDEPTIGIDPIQVVETRRLIQELGREQTVVLSTHILPEVSMICDRVLIISEGKIVAEDTPDNLAERLKGSEQMEVEIGGPVSQVLPALRALNGVASASHRSIQGKEIYTIQANEGEDLRDDISRTVIGAGWSLLSMNTMGMSLEEIFLKLTTHEEL